MGRCVVLGTTYLPTYLPRVSLLPSSTSTIKHGRYSLGLHSRHVSSHDVTSFITPKLPRQTSHFSKPGGGGSRASYPNRNYRPIIHNPHIPTHIYTRHQKAWLPQVHLTPATTIANTGRQNQRNDHQLSPRLHCRRPSNPGH